MKFLINYLRVSLYFPYFLFFLKEEKKGVQLPFLRITFLLSSFFIYIYTAKHYAEVKKEGRFFPIWKKSFWKLFDTV